MRIKQGVVICTLSVAMLCLSSLVCTSTFGVKSTNIGKLPVDEKKEENKFITMNFEDADIKSVIKFVSELTGRNFIIDDKVKGKVTIISPTKITVSEAYQVFLSILEVHGFTTVKAGKVTKIIRAREAKQKDVSTRLDGEFSGISYEDKVVTQIIRLEYADVNNVKKSFAPLISRDSSIVAYSPTNTLIITDIASNIKRLSKILTEIDMKSPYETMSVMSLDFASAKNMAEKIKLIIAEEKRVAGKKVVEGRERVIKVVPDERTNSLIILANLEDTQRINDLIEKLDRETPRGKGRIHVCYLKNAVAEELAQVLTKITAQKKGPPIKGQAPEFIGDIVIEPDKATNSLVITAAPTDYKILTEIIGKLDILRPQVFVEALIMEISLDTTRELGIEWVGGAKISDDGGIDGAAFGGSTRQGGNMPDLLASIESGTPPIFPGGIVGFVGKTFAFKDKEYPSFTTLISALQADTDVNILSTPQILTTDNEEAEIIISENIPLVTKTLTSTELTTSRSIERKDVGITLRLKPQISEGDFVRLNIYQEVSGVVEGSESSELGASYTKRSAKTTVVVKDKQTVAIGGLVRNDKTKGITKIPILGDIPILGWLFKYQNKRREKVNLLVMLTPHIVRNYPDLDNITKKKREDLEKLQEKFE
ncbi:MAG: type II secretion system secretin GspD [Thermodesulfobacteriota bacterium]|nr:type II secretion system secretin GspD [Thermodesulfobacteriota bacterium]